MARNQPIERRAAGASGHAAQTAPRRLTVALDWLPRRFGLALDRRARRAARALAQPARATPQRGPRGSVGALYRKPKLYARFLGQELCFVYKGRVLVVMPNGYGISRGGKLLPVVQRIDGGLPAPGTDGRGLATAAVRKLAAASDRDRGLVAIAGGAAAILVRRRRA